LVALALAWLQWLQKGELLPEPLDRDLEKVVGRLRRWGIAPNPGETFEQLCRRAGQQQPVAREALGELAHSHGLLRFARLNQQERRRQWAAWRTALRFLQKTYPGTL
jgi:hypothetical protein